MLAVKEIESKSNELISIEYINPVGVIVDNCLMLHKHGRTLIELDSIRKVQIVKMRSYTYNAAFAMGTIPFIYFSISHEFNTLELVMIGVLTTLLLGMALFIKKLKYVLLVNKFDLNRIEVEINEHHKEDAKKIVKVINKRIGHSIKQNVII